jgi:hypothetical protein
MEGKAISTGSRKNLNGDWVVMGGKSLGGRLEAKGMGEAGRHERKR